MPLDALDAVGLGEAVTRPTMRHVAIKSPEPAIRAVAAALLARRVLTGDEVAVLVADHPPRLRIRAGRAVRCGT